MDMLCDDPGLYCTVICCFMALLACDACQSSGRSFNYKRFPFTIPLEVYWLICYPLNSRVIVVRKYPKSLEVTEIGPFNTYNNAVVKIV